MKTIKIFLASSEEMDYDRMVFGNLVRRLDDVYEKRGLRIKLFEWEDYDAAFNDRRKQDEYNERVKDSDIFLALFHKKAGKFTIEEFDIASAEFKEKASPKVYTYLRDLKPGEEESPELAEFKKRLFDEMGHYWCRYDNRDSLQLQFVMQLQLVESSLGDSVKVEDGQVNIDGMKVASMDKLQFAAANEDYLKQQQEIQELRNEIEEIQLDLEKKEKKLEKRRARLEEDPDDEDNQEDYQDAKEDVDKLVEKLQPKLDKYNKLKEEFAEYQTLLFDTAKRVAQLQGQRITERMRRAMDAFNAGKVREANIILDEAESDAQRNLDDYKQSKEITELKRQAVIFSIEELLLKTSLLMADTSRPIEERIDESRNIFDQAEHMARSIEYDVLKFADLLSRYGCFLNSIGWNGESLLYLQESLEIREKILGDGHPDIAASFYEIGIVCQDLCDFSASLNYYLKSLKIREKQLGSNHPDTASSYNRIGTIYEEIGEYSKALDYLINALKIREVIFGENHPDTASSYNNIGNVYCDLSNYQAALEYHLKALRIREKIFGENHPDTAISYHNIGTIYCDLCDFKNALVFLQKALAIFRVTLGDHHPRTGKTYSTIGISYDKMGDSKKATIYHSKASLIEESLSGL